MIVLLFFNVQVQTQIVSCNTQEAKELLDSSPLSNQQTDDLGFISAFHPVYLCQKWHCWLVYSALFSVYH